ncbi:MAG: methyltransferase domain-containing protein [Elusimicrobiales bacterium]
MKPVKRIKEFVGKLFPQTIRGYKQYRNLFAGKTGLEIGGPSDVFRTIIPIYGIIDSLDGCNFSNHTIWEGQLNEGHSYAFHPGKPNGRQFICEATDLSEIKSGEYDFVLACHSIEHSANPMKAVSEWLRVIKPGGHLLIIAPDKNATFDRLRAVTTFAHLLDDFRKDVDETDLEHLDEIMGLHDLSMDIAAGDLDSFRQRSLKNYENRCLHQHVFDAALLAQMALHFKLNIVDLQQAFSIHIIMLAQKL